MEQLLQLERFKKTLLADIEVLAIAPDPILETASARAKVEAARGVRLTHRFLADADYKVFPRYQIRMPTLILIDRDGREVWRFVERPGRLRLADDELELGVRRLSPAPLEPARKQ